MAFDMILLVIYTTQNQPKKRKQSLIPFMCQPYIRPLYTHYCYYNLPMTRPMCASQQPNTDFFDCSVLVLDLFPCLHYLPINCHYIVILTYRSNHRWLCLVECPSCHCFHCHYFSSLGCDRKLENVLKKTKLKVSAKSLGKYWTFCGMH